MELLIILVVILVILYALGGWGDRFYAYGNPGPFSALVVLIVILLLLHFLLHAF